MDFSNWRDADYYDLSSQTTIYSLAGMKTERDTSKFLVSCINCHFHSIEYHPTPSETGNATAPLMKTIQFSSLPLAGDAEIVAISVFERLPPAKGLVVGITYVIAYRTLEKDGKKYSRRRSPQKDEFKSKEKGPQYYSEASGKLLLPHDKQRSAEQQDPMPVNQALNVYSLPMDDEEGAGKMSDKLFNLEAIAEHCQSVTLPYIPYCMTNTVVEMKNGVSEPVFLITGSDFEVHLYKEDLGPHPGVVESVGVDLFPEFKELSDIVMLIEIAKPDADHRVTAIAFQNGPLEVFQVNVKTLETVNVWKASVDGPISCLHFFTQRKKAPVPPSFQGYVDETGQGGLREEMENPDFTQLHLLMTTHLQPSAVYRNVLNCGLLEVMTLPDSDKYDSANCGLALDVDFDGENEVIVGTFGQELLVYKFFPTTEKEVPIPPSERESSTSPPSSSRRLTVSGLSPMEESSKHRHKSEEGNSGGRSQDPQRKVRSQENLMSMLPQEGGKESAGQEGATAAGGGGGGGGGGGAAAAAASGGAAEKRTILEPHYQLQSRKSFPCPIMALGGGDMMGDGVENLVVLTVFGIHVLQPDVSKLMDLIAERMKQMDLVVNAEDAGDDFHKLQLE